MYPQPRITRRCITVAATLGLFLSSSTAIPVFGQGAMRTLPDSCAPGASLTVSITVDAPPGTFVVNLEDSPPPEWTDVGSISDGGMYDSVYHKVKWGPFFSNLSRTVTYEVTPPGGTTGEQCFAGTVFFDGNPKPIGGDECCAGLVKGDFDGDEDVDLEDHAVLVDCIAGPGMSPDPTPPVTAQDCLDVFDFDEDDDVDLFDMAEHQTAFTGP